MYQVKKYSNAWVLHDLDREISRVLTEGEIEQVKVEQPELLNDKCVSVFSDGFPCLGAV